MKILGITRLSDLGNITYLKPDSSLLVNSKPFFIPDFWADLIAIPCLVLRVSRLGKCIEERFASRYYDAVALGYNIRCTDQELSACHSTLTAFAFDSSAVVGAFAECDIDTLVAQFADTKLGSDKLVCSIGSAIAQVSRDLTIRMGDMVCVDFDTKPIELSIGMRLEATMNQQIALQCNIR